MLLILGAVERELLPLLKHLKHSKRISWQNRDFFKGFLFDKKAIVVPTGIGVVNATYTLSLLLPFKKLIKWIFITGCGGGFPHKGLKTGDVAVATAEAWAEAGAYTKKGWLSLEQIGLPLIKLNGHKFYQQFRLLEPASKWLERLPANIKQGPFLTVSATTGNQERLKELKRRFPEVICENMEGVAVAQIATLTNIPWFECRGISNIIGDYDKSQWQIELAAYNAAQVLLKLIKEL